MRDAPTMAEASTYGSCICGKRFARVTRQESGCRPEVDRFTPIGDHSTAAATANCDGCGAALQAAWRPSAATLGVLAGGRYG